MHPGKWSYGRFHNWLIEKVKTRYGLKTHHVGAYYQVPPLFGMRELSNDEADFMDFVRDHPKTAWFVFNFLNYPIYFRSKLSQNLDSIKYRIYDWLYDNSTFPNYQNNLLFVTFEMIRKTVEMQITNRNEVTISDVLGRLLFVIRHGRGAVSEDEKVRGLGILTEYARNERSHSIRNDYILMARLYVWWVYERPSRPDPDQVTRHRELMIDFHNSNISDDFYCGSGRRALVRASDERAELWLKYQNEDDAMLELAIRNRKKLEI